ncbi:MAG TPA: ATP-binding protein [Streptosporangiaceae bacterium]|nr:ATP-binding protein [Streptosporangiaceae bacterium]
MGVTSGIGGSTGGLWYRVQAVDASCLGGTAVADYASVLPAALNAARHRRPFIAGWLSRGGGAPLELITTAGPLPEPVRAAKPAEPGSAEPPGPQPDADPRAAAEPPAAADPEARTGPEPAPAPEVAPAAGSPTVELLFPWGARGIAIDSNMLADLDELVWAPCPGRQVPLTGSSPRPGSPELPGPPTLFESALQTLMGRAFGWLIVADPTDLLDPEAAELRNQLTVLRRYDDENARFEAERAERRLTELDAFREAGLWNVRVLAGAATEQDLHLIAPVLVGAADLSAHPYRLRCPDGAQEFADVLATKLADPVDGSMVPFAATAGTLAALTGLPRREVPGVRVLRPGYFDVTSEVGGEQSIDLGQILDGQDRAVGSLRVPLATLNRHALVTGATGAGKSQTVRHMLEQLTSAGVGWLAIEPVKSEYAAMAGKDGPGSGEVTLINPADPESVPLSVNPLAPEPGYPVQAHIDMVRALFLAAFDAREPFPQIMSQALQRAYEECGWDPLTGAGRADLNVPPAVPTLARLQAAALAVIEDVGYGRELQADMRGFVDVRLRSLRTGSAGRFFEGGHPADIAALLNRNVVLSLDDVANDEDKAFVIGTLIIRIVEHLRLRSKTAPADGLRHVVVLEEAHRLLRAGRDGASAHAVELFAGLLAEIRAYGEGVIIAEQIPAKLVPDAVKNTALKVLHRLPAADDRQLVGATMNLDDDQSRQVVSLPPGEAAVFTDGMDRPMRVRVPFRAGAAGAGAAVAGPREVAATAILPPLTGRRSAACGRACTGERPCTLVEIRAADLVARSPQDAWLRVWSEVYVLAHLVNRPRPRVPVPLRERWAGLDRRLRECALATAIDQAVLSRGQALRECFDPAELAAACAASATGMLDGGKGAGTMPGTTWVIPQLRWLHEIERACPFDGPEPDPFATAPPLDYALPDLADRADVKIGQRVSGLRRHPLSMEVTHNRLIAWSALLGEDDQAAFIDDLAAVAIGVSHRGQLRKAAGEMGVTGWLEAVLSWPRRFIVGADDQASSLPAREPDPVAG